MVQYHCKALSARVGHPVTLLEGSRELGGRVVHESALPGLAAWRRVADHRQQQLALLEKVEVYRESPTTAQDVLDFGFEHVVVATGARWRADGVGRHSTRALPVADGCDVLTPDDLFAGRRPAGRSVVLYDDDHYYLGGVLAELLTAEGFAVTLVTPAPLASAWTANTLEVGRIQARLLRSGVTLRPSRALTAVAPGEVRTACVFTGDADSTQADGVVTVTARLPRAEVAGELLAARDRWAAAGVRSVTAIGDCLAPSTIAAAVHAGHRYARELGEPPAGDVPFRRELTALSPDFP